MTARPVLTPRSFLGFIAFIRPSRFYRASFNVRPHRNSKTQHVKIRALTCKNATNQQLDATPAFVASVRFPFLTGRLYTLILYITPSRHRAECSPSVQSGLRDSPKWSPRVASRFCEARFFWDEYQEHGPHLPRLTCSNGRKQPCGGASSPSPWPCG